MMLKTFQAFMWWSQDVILVTSLDVSRDIIAIENAYQISH